MEKGENIENSKKLDQSYRPKHGNFIHGKWARIFLVLTMVLSVSSAPQMDLISPKNNEVTTKAEVSVVSTNTAAQTTTYIPDELKVTSAQTTVDSQATVMASVAQTTSFSMVI